MYVTGKNNLHAIPLISLISRVFGKTVWKKVHAKIQKLDKSRVLFTKKDLLLEPPNHSYSKIQPSKIESIQSRASSKQALQASRFIRK